MKQPEQQTDAPNPRWTLEQVHDLSSAVLHLASSEFAAPENWPKALPQDSSLLRSMSGDELLAFCKYIRKKVGPDKRSLKCLMEDYDRASDSLLRESISGALTRFFFSSDTTHTISARTAAREPRSRGDPKEEGRISARPPARYDLVDRFGHMDLGRALKKDRSGEERLTKYFDESDRKKLAGERKQGGTFDECYRLVAADKVPDKLLRVLIRSDSDS